MNRNFYSPNTLSRLSIALVLFFASFSSVKASHTMGADISYKCVGPNQFEVTLKFYRDCSGSPNPGGCNYSFGAGCSVGSSSCVAPGTVYIYALSASCGYCLKDSFLAPYSVKEVTPLCPTQTSICSGGTVKGVQQWTYKKVITLPAQCTDWRFVYGNFARNSSITTLTSTSVGMYVQATLNNVAAPCNSSPEFVNLPVPWVCVGKQFCYSHGAVEPDGDSITYSLVNPLKDINNATVTYKAGFSATNPLTSVPPVAFDVKTGQICFTPSLVEVTVLAVKINEYRNGVLIGSTVRDMQVTVVNCSNTPPALTGIDSSTVFIDSICAGSTVCFNVHGSDPDGGNLVQMSWDTTIAGASFTVTNNHTANPIGNFCWTPSFADARSAPYTFNVTVHDDNCPYYGVQSFPYTIYVKSCGAPPQAVFISSDTTFCNEGGQCIDFTDQSFGNPTSWEWKFPGAIPDTSTMQNPTGICYYVPGSYNVTLIVTNQYGIDTLDVLPHVVFGSGATAPVLFVRNDTIFCSHEFTYQWYYNGSPITGATDSFFVAKLDGNYSVYITDNIGCSRLSGGLLFTGGIDQLNYLTNQIKIYPNPAGDQFEVSGLRSEVNEAVLELHNLLGETVYREQLQTANHKPQAINVSSLSNGIYLVQIQMGNSVINKKLVIAR